MKRIDKIGKHLCTARIRQVGVNKTRARRRFTREEIVSKREEGLYYIVLKGKVYDVTEFLEEHPGGAELITDIEADDFETMDMEFDEADHSDEAMDDLKELYVGKLIGDDESEDESDNSDDNSEEEHHETIRVPLTLEEQKTPFAKFQELDLALVDTFSVSHDVIVFRFALPSKYFHLGLPVGQHIILSFVEYGTTINRAYTPVSPRGEKGFVDFLIKLYPTGKMSNHLPTLVIGDTIKMRGPKGKLEYFGSGNFLIRKQEMKLSHLGMIAGGSGITPMFQILQAITMAGDTSMTISLLYANKSESDILLREAIEEFQLKIPTIKIHYTLDSPPANWKYHSGFITADMITATMPPPAPDTVILLCGPPPMVKKACIPNLQNLGYTYFAF